MITPVLDKNYSEIFWRHSWNVSNLVQNIFSLFHKWIKSTGSIFLPLWLNITTSTELNISLFLWGKYSYMGKFLYNLCIINDMRALIYKILQKRKKIWQKVTKKVKIWQMQFSSPKKYIIPPSPPTRGDYINIYWWSVI